MSRFAFSVFFLLFFKDLDECLSSPCQHGAVCENTKGSYSCSCNDGWAGKDCNEGTIYNYILYNLVYNFIFLLSMSLNEKLFCTGKEENNVLLFFFLFLLHVVVCFYETLENIFIVDLSLSSISKHVFCYL